MEELKPHNRITTVAIVEKSSAEVIRYDVLEATDSPYQLVSDYFDCFVKEVLPQMQKDEERYYLLYSRAEGLRPDVREVGIINKPFTVEHSVTGYPGPGFVKTFTDDIVWGDAKVVKKGAFPRPPGTDSLAVIDDGGIDEEAIRAAMVNVLSILRAAVIDKFSEQSRLALLEGLTGLMQSTGTKGEPSEYWDSWDSMEESAVNLYDAAILLWLESGAASDLPSNMVSGYRERMLEDSKRSEVILDIANNIERDPLFCSGIHYR